MNLNEPFVIAINRELGSGGSTVASVLSSKLNIPFYGKVLIRELEKKYNLTKEEIERLKGKKKSWWDDFDTLVRPFVDASQKDFLDHYIEAELTPTSENVFAAEKEILQGIAQNGSCIVTGRTAFWVFKDHPNFLSVFIKSPIEHRIARVMVKQNMSREDATKLIDKLDEMRENYVQRYTGTSRYDARNYDLVINMNGLTEEKAAQLILDYIG